MKYFKFGIIMIGLLCCSMAGAFAKGSATITIHVENKELRKEKMRLLLLDEYIFDGLGSYEMIESADAKGDFTFNIKNMDTYKKIRIEFDILPFIFSYIEPGDHFKVYFSGAKNSRITVKDFKFSGRGWAKIAASNALEYSLKGPGIKLSRTSKYDQVKIDSLLKMGDAIYAYRMGIVNSYGNQISNTMRNVFRVELFGIANYIMTSFFDSNKSAVIDSNGVNYMLHEIKKRDTNNQTFITANSAGYLNYLWKNSVFTIKNRKGIAREKMYSSIFKHLVSSNTGKVREKVILYFICRDTHVKFSDDAEWVYAKALELMSTRKHREFLESTIASRKIGVKAFDFKLTNINGDTVRLHDFRGKVVMLEAWYRGCGGCAGLAEVVKSSVLPHFVNNKDVVFLTVSIDRAKEKWLSGIESGLYTNEKSINLFTYGLGQNHPLFLYYRFQSMPQLLIIGRDGNLLSMDINHNGEELTRRINLALK